MINTVYGNKVLKKALIYMILKAVKEGNDATDQHGRLTKKSVITPLLVASVAASFQAERRINIRELAKREGTSFSTIFCMVLKEQGLVKKSARWVPKLLLLD